MVRPLWCHRLPDYLRHPSEGVAFLFSRSLMPALMSIAASRPTLRPFSLAC